MDYDHYQILKKQLYTTLLRPVVTYDDILTYYTYLWWYWLLRKNYKKKFLVLKKNIIKDCCTSERYAKWWVDNKEKWWNWDTLLKTEYTSHDKEWKDAVGWIRLAHSKAIYTHSAGRKSHNKKPLGRSWDNMQKFSKERREIFWRRYRLVCGPSDYLRRRTIPLDKTA